jgi:hypothetical protein
MKYLALVQEVDNEGKLYRERFQASDIDWFKRVIKSFRTSLNYTKEVRFPLRFRRLIIMIRTEYEPSRNVGESQPLTWFLS